MGFDGTINIPTLVTITLAVLAAVIWLVRLEGKVNGSTQKLDAAHALTILHQNQLSEYKLHVAETYVTKQGMSEQTDRIIKTITDVGSRVDSLGSRLDRLYENQPSPRTRRPSGG